MQKKNPQNRIESPTLIGLLICARPQSKHFPQIMLRMHRNYEYLHFRDGETEAQRDQSPSPRSAGRQQSHSWNPGSLATSAHPFSHYSMLHSNNNLPPGFIGSLPISFRNQKLPFQFKVCQANSLLIFCILREIILSKNKSITCINNRFGFQAIGNS